MQGKASFITRRKIFLLSNDSCKVTLVHTQLQDKVDTLGNLEGSWKYTSNHYRSFPVIFYHA